ncbi:MAG: hypothetical protein PHO29_11900 [Acetobacterium sp.]|nr:hypothetical protein [Acetobacterium sp.]
MITLSAARDIFKKSGEEFMEMIFKAAEALAELDEKETGLEYFETYMRYILTSGPKLTTEQLKTVIKELAVTYKKGSEVAMTLAEVLREEGRKEVRDIERYEAKKESLFDLAIDHLALKFGVLPTECQEKIASLDLKMLQIFNINIGNFKSIEDVKKFLAI